MSVDLPPAPLPPPPPPPPPPPLHTPVLAPSASSKKKLYQAIAEGKAPVEGDFEEARLLLAQRESRKDLEWVLCNKYVPSLIQDGPKCGLVALWMATHLLMPTQTISVEKIVQTALDKGYTAQGEMFSAGDMALLAEEVCGCGVQRLSGGIAGDNAALILRHLTDGQPVLIPYDEDFNHEPCLRHGHKAHWAVASGVLFGLLQGSVPSRHFSTDATLPWLHLSEGRAPAEWPPNAVAEVYILAKQGKSLRYQLWKFETVAQSNAQLKEMDPQRSSDGTHYVLPPGGVEEGLAGQVLLLHSKTN
ncbi:actin maturation protease isoform X2 [Salminus brasiliensis]|uniref:actin maturation protease isoform X2 n=1 Tax=Salminus brasiliensis TaxID=930266 RepID=UPI003B839B81